MNALNEIRQRLKKYPDLRYTDSDSSIVIEAPSPTGFSVSFNQSNNRSTVSFDGWHETFDSEREALNCFAFGFSDQCRLKVHLRGTFAHKWTLEHRTDEGWTEDSTVGLLVFPFWGSPSIVYLQNSIVSTQGATD